MSEFVRVRRELLEQVFGMAGEGCDVPAVAHRWCERIDDLIHGGRASEEYAEFAKPLPAAMLAAAPSPPEGDAEPRLIAALRRLNRYHVDDDGLTHVDAGGEWIDVHDIDRLLTTHGHGGGGEG